MNKPSAYTHFFGFSQKPFSAEPDLKSLFLAKSQKEVLIPMVQGIHERRGIIVLTGERGTGKTTLLHYLQARLGQKVKVVFISRVAIFFRQILKQIAQELRLPLPDETPGHFLSQLRDCLTEGMKRGENLAIFVDDAQNLHQETFEELGLLAKLQEQGARLVQIVLAGRPELEDILNSEALRPLGQQIWTRLRLQPLLPEESRLFIEQSLEGVGRSSREVLTPEALDLIIREGGGIFRNIISLGDRAFRKGLDAQQKMIDAAVIREIGLEGDGPSGEEIPQLPETIDRDILLRRLFQNPPRITKPGILREAISWLKRRTSYLYIPGTLVLGLFFYLGWEFLFTPSPPMIQKGEAPAPAAKEQIIIPAAPEQKEASIRDASTARSEEKPEKVQPAPAREEGLPQATQSKAQLKAEEKPAAPIPPKPPPPAVTKKEPKAELKTPVKREIRFNEPVGVPKGKTLYAFARDYYQDANHTLVDYILDANPHIKDIDGIPTDQKIVIPEISEKSLLVQSSDGSWRIRLGTFERQEADKVFKEEPLLAEKEIKSVPYQVSPKTTWYRLYAGQFDTMEEALKTTQGLRKKGLLPALKKR